MLKYTLLTSVILILNGYFVNAQDCPPNDSIKRIIDKLNYHSDFEKDIFYSYFNSASDTNILKLVLAADKRTTQQDFLQIQKEIASMAEKIRSNSKFEKSDKKRIKHIFTTVHEELLLKYEPLVNFYDIFIDGKYNCLTASIIYALLFDRFKIPYQARFTIDHVFLIAYPNSSHIIVETTNPIRGTFSYSSKDKQQFVDYLIEMKLITLDEYNKIPVDSLFQQHYLNQTKGGIIDLIGAQYSNLGVNYELKDDKYRAFDSYQKALMFYRTPHILLYITFIGEHILLNYDFTSIDDAPYHIAYWELQKQYFGNDLIGDFFISLTNEFLSERNKPFTYDKVFNTYMENITDTAWRKEIAFIYNYERGRHLHNSMNYKAANPYFINAFKLKPNNLNTLQVVYSNLYQIIVNDDPEESLKSLDSAIDTVPSLLDIPKIQLLRSTCLLFCSETNFHYKKYDLAFKYQEEFEQCAIDTLINKIKIEENIANVYSMAAKYYFKRGDYKKARAYFQRGLTIIPGNLKLKIGLEQLSGY